MAMVITRRAGEAVTLETANGERIVVTVDSIGAGKARLVVDAPETISVERGRGAPNLRRPTD